MGGCGLLGLWACWRCCLGLWALVGALAGLPSAFCWACGSALVGGRFCWAALAGLCGRCCWDSGWAWHSSRFVGFLGLWVLVGAFACGFAAPTCADMRPHALAFCRSFFPVVPASRVATHHHPEVYPFKMHTSPKAATLWAHFLRAGGRLQVAALLRFCEDCGWALLGLWALLLGLRALGLAGLVGALCGRFCWACGLGLWAAGLGALVGLRALFLGLTVWPLFALWALVLGL